jgi:hypothetical protein
VKVLAQPSREDEILSAAAKELKELDAVIEAAKRGDAKSMIDSQKELEKINEKLIELAKAEIPRNSDDRVKQRLLDAVNSLQRNIKEESNDANKATANPSDVNAQNNLRSDAEKIRAAVKQIIEDSKAESISQVHRIQLMLLTNICRLTDL